MTKAVWIACGLFILSGCTESQPDRVERMKRECAQQFPNAVEECVVKLLIRDGNERLNTAYQRSR